VISLEPPNVFTAGVVNLYTQEFYELGRRHLQPGGIMLQWLPTMQLSKDDRGRLIRAFTEAFPHVTIWQQLRGTTLLAVGSLAPLALDVDAIDRRVQADIMHKDVATMNVRNALGFLSFFLLNDTSARRLVATYEPVRDDKTVVDYSIPRFVGAGFGLSLYDYPIGTGTLQQVMRERLAEYDSWGDSAASIVPDPSQAARLDRAIRYRMAGKPGYLADEETPRVLAGSDGAAAGAPGTSP